MSHEAALSIRNNSEKEAPFLTRREKEVHEPIALGNTNQEIADNLFISYGNVGSLKLFVANV